MRYTLVWVSTADDELARIWTDAADKRAVTEATNEIERRLKRRRSWLERITTTTGASSSIPWKSFTRCRRTTAWFASFGLLAVCDAFGKVKRCGSAETKAAHGK